MTTLEHAEAVRDQLHDLPAGWTDAEERAIDQMAMELAERKFDKLDKESLRDEWVERHWEEFIDAAVDQLGLL